MSGEPTTFDGCLVSVCVSLLLVDQWGGVPCSRLQSWSSVVTVRCITLPCPTELAYIHDARLTLGFRAVSVKGLRG
jgi:hypothetical protein